MKISKLVWRAIRVRPEAYEEGQLAGLERKNIEACPYERATLEWVAWRAGWWGV
jgi:ribosome modulation factor